MLTLAAFKSMVREQFLMLLIDPEAALAAIPAMLPADADKRQKGFELVEEVVTARGALAADQIERSARIAGLFGIDRDASGLPVVRRLSLVPEQSGEHAKAS